MSDVYVYVQSKGGKIVKASFEAASAGKRLADALGSKARAIVIGSAQNVADLGKYGIATAHHVADSAFDNYSQDGFAVAIANIAKAGNAGAVLFSATAQGRDLAPRVAARLDAGYAADITELNGSAGKISAKRPVYAGKGYVNIEIDGVFVASLRPNVFPATETGGTCAVENTAPGIGRADFKAVVTETLAATGGKLDVAEAEIIVTGGRGLKGPENWNLIE
ncbi:MAG: electron transfer flavoprotein subunit alpha/FixB family protein, partial [Planctomycetes bacterium]|nr:electron transfer flavoprotein subunit alpha/FixB family protein [Planctomycetota bacterium]